LLEREFVHYSKRIKCFCEGDFKKGQKAMFFVGKLRHPPRKNSAQISIMINYLFSSPFRHMEVSNSAADTYTTSALISPPDPNTIKCINSAYKSDDRTKRLIKKSQYDI
jgi:hypothetical protein